MEPAKYDIHLRAVSVRREPERLRLAVFALVGGGGEQFAGKPLPPLLALLRSNRKPRFYKCLLSRHSSPERESFSEKSLQKGLWRGIFPSFLTTPVFITGGSVSVWGVQFEIRRVRTIKWKHLTEAPQFILTAARKLFVIVIDTRTRFPLEYNRF